MINMLLLLVYYKFMLHSYIGFVSFRIIITTYCHNKKELNIVVEVDKRGLVQEKSIHDTLVSQQTSIKIRR